MSTDLVMVAATAEPESPTFSGSSIAHVSLASHNAMRCFM